MQGIPTVLITVEPGESAQARPPRALAPRPYGPGSSLGRPNAPELQLRILGDALDLIEHAVEPGKIVEREYV